MAQANQIIPKYSFPYVETIINDYTLIKSPDLGANNSSTVTQAYAVISSKGPDNRWIKETNRQNAINRFGDSNFKKYGQPLMQALHVLENPNAAVWMMRVMPENATYANSYVSAYYKIDNRDEVEASKRKFRIKLVSKSREGIDDNTKFANGLNDADLTVMDSEGYKQLPLFAARYCGRGSCGNNFSLRVSAAKTYEREYGIKMYNFEVLNSESGVVKEASCPGALVDSFKYGKELSTLISDILSDDADNYPLTIKVAEDGVEELYEKYAEFIAELHEDLLVEYDNKLDDYDIPQEIMNKESPVTEEYEEQYNELLEIAALIELTEKTPDLDEFDPLFGTPVNESYTYHPGILFPTKITDDVDTTADDFVAEDYTYTDIINFNSLKGLVLLNGTNGYFDEPRTEIDDTTGIHNKWTLEDEYEDALIKAFDGSYDKRIISPSRIPISVMFDANYPYRVKRAIVDIFEKRNDACVQLDIGIVSSLSGEVRSSIINDFSIFDSNMISFELQNYQVKEYSTHKKCYVTSNYFLSEDFVSHVSRYGVQYPYVREYAKLSGHVRDSLRPIVEEYDVDVKEELKSYRINYFECVGENEFHRATQYTSQKDETDLIEISNSLILYEVKRDLERELKRQLYNFADNSIRSDFVNYLKAKYAPMIGSLVESIDFWFTVSEYEFEHSILHFHVGMKFRKLTKQIILEIDLNRTEYNESIEVDA